MKLYFTNHLILSAACILGACQTNITEEQDEAVIWHSDAYSIYPDSVLQGQFIAHVISDEELTSNYRSPANEFLSPGITFKFSINGKDNEMISGRDHYFNCLATEGACETSIIKFGDQFVDTRPVPEDTYLKPNTTLRIRLDMRHVLEDFETKGYYESFNGEKIYKEDFKAVYVAGGTSPLMWDFDNLVNNPQLELKDPDEDGIYEAELLMNVYDEEKITASEWKLSRDIYSLPQYSSDYPLLNAMYKMSLEEMLKNVEEDGTFRTGKEWAGVWTRDISYSLILSMANLRPKVAKSSLMRKVKNDRIVQDTGTGGAYPVSTDRIVWAVAAWELYNATGDREWLESSYSIIRNSMEDDLVNAFDESTGLFRGESSFLDWREQSYPEWMQPADIYESQNLGTNAVFYRASVILSKMAELLKDNEAKGKYAALADTVKNGIEEHLWIPDKGYYGQYLYGRNFKILSPRSEALGEALAVIFGVADSVKQKLVVASTPVTAFGITTIYPQIPNIPPYHNNGIWPFVQAYWSLAAAKAGNEDALMESLSAIYRPAAFFLTNKENFVASTGDYAGTQINSDRQLWSVAGNLAMVYKVLIGMEFKPDKLVFTPFVPEAFAGKHRITNFKYRNAVLDIEVEGYGNKIQRFTLGGKKRKAFEVPGDLEGQHKIRIKLTNNTNKGKRLNKVADYTSPATPKVILQKDELQWDQQEGIEKYKVMVNGEEFITTPKTRIRVSKDEYSEYQIIAVDEHGYESFASEPLRVGTEDAVVTYEMEQFANKSDQSYRGFSGDGFVEISKSSNTSITLHVKVPKKGLYSIDFRYSNGSGPINTDNKAAIRTLKINGSFAGTVVLPQRGADEWSNWGFTNSIHAELERGTHILTLSFEPANENMHGEINRALVDYVRLTMLEGEI